MADPRFLTVPELAALLRIKERKVYALAASGEIPVSRVTGKLLFPRDAVDAWIAGHSTEPAPRTRPTVMVGSHDPLLEWALRESGCGVATFLDGSLDGLARFAAGEAIGAGLHIRDPETGAWNIGLVERELGGQPVVLVEWAWRERGLLFPPGPKTAIAGVADLAGRRVVRRQPGAGAQRMLEALMQGAGLDDDAVRWTEAAVRSEADAGLAIADGKADAALGLAAVARAYRLGFVPLARERFDLVLWRRAYFEAPLQAFLAFCRSGALAERAGELGGYDVTGFGAVHYNGP